MENHIKMDDLGGKPTIFGNIHVILVKCQKNTGNQHDNFSQGNDFEGICFFLGIIVKCHPYLFGGGTKLIANVLD